jgi:hypothetical protein
MQRGMDEDTLTLLAAVQVVQSEGLIYMVLEYGDIDLARLLAKHEKARREDGAEDLDENFIRLYWQQMLQVIIGHSCWTCSNKHSIDIPSGRMAFHMPACLSFLILRGCNDHLCVCKKMPLQSRCSDL